MHHRIPRLVGSLGLALTLTTGMFAGSALAAAAPLTPTGTNLSPAFVSNGGLAAFSVTATNDGPSNISQLYLTGPSDAPVYGVEASASIAGVETPLSGVCTTSGQLLCSFGAVNALDSVTVKVALTTPSSGSSWTADFEWSTTGYVTDQKGKNKSHGDAFPYTFDVNLSNDKDKAGSYVWDSSQSVVQNSSINRNNPQSTKVNVNVTKVPVSVEDGSTISCVGYDVTCPASLFGQTSQVNVDNDHYQSSLFVIVIQVYHGPNANQVNGVYHSWNDGTGNHDENIPLCTSSTPTTPCVQPENVMGGNLQLTIYTWHNGNYRGW